LAVAFNWVAVSGVPWDIGAGVGQVIVGAVGVTGMTGVIGAIGVVGVVDAPPPQPPMGMSRQAARVPGKVSLKRKKDDNSSPRGFSSHAAFRRNEIDVGRRIEVSVYLLR
jgi:hypothetical protein